MNINTIIVDNFLDNPDKVRDCILTIPFNNTGIYPGFRSDAADFDYQLMIENKFKQIIQKNIKFREDRDCFRFQLCFEETVSWIHKDDVEWAGVLYLTPNADINSGTGIFNSNKELVTMLGNVYNRLVLYKGNLFHRSIVSGFGNSIETGRLTQVFFFDTF